MPSSPPPPPPSPHHGSHAEALLLSAGCTVEHSVAFPWMALAFEAFYYFLNQEVWMSMFLRGQQKDGEIVCGVDLHEAIIATEGELSAQLAAGACLTYICVCEALSGDYEQDIVFPNLYCPLVRSNRSMAAVVHIIEQAVKVRLLPTCCSVFAR